MPVAIEVVEIIDQMQPRVVEVAVGFAQRPTLTALSETTKLREEGPSVSVMTRETRVTHFMQKHTALRPRTEPALNENMPPLRLEKTVASVRAREIRGAPHRTRRDEAVEELGVQLIKQPLERDSSGAKRHSRGTNVAAPRSEQTIFRPAQQIHELRLVRRIYGEDVDQG